MVDETKPETLTEEEQKKKDAEVKEKAEGIEETGK